MTEGTLNTKVVNFLGPKTWIVAIAVLVGIPFLVISFLAIGGDYTFAAVNHSGDGLGTIASFGLLKDAKGLDPQSEGLIDPLMVVPSVYQDKWKPLYKFLGYFFSPDNVYDSLVLIFWLANFAAAWFLFRSLKASPLAAVIFALVVAGLEFFGARISGHLTLALVAFNLIQIAFVVRYFFKPDIKNAVLLAGVTLVCFVSNEYYGYFGTIYAAVLFFMLFILHPSRIKEIAWRGLLIAILVFLVGMVLLYFDIFRAMFFDAAKKTMIAHSPAEMAFYSMKKPFELFDGGLVRFGVNWGNPAEFTYHIGPWVLLFCVFGLLFAWRKKLAIDMRIIVAFLAAGLVLASFGMTPESRFSLGKITERIAPQFRVGSRAYLWVGLSGIMCASLVFSALLRFGGRLQITKVIFRVVLGISALLLLFDTTAGFYVRGPKLYGLPDKSVYAEIRDLPPGRLLEVPFWGPNDSPEASYVYNYNRFFHKKTIVNLASHQMMSYNPRLAGALLSFKARVERASEADIEALARAGIRYVASSDLTYTEKVKASGRNPVAEKGAVAIFDIGGDPKADLLGYVLSLPVIDFDFSVYKIPSVIVGAHTDKGIATTAQEGMLVYGPYMPVASGLYTLELLLDVKSVSAARADVVYDQGRKKLLDISLSRLGPGKHRIVKEVNVGDGVYDMEVRVWVDAAASLTVLGYRLTSQDVTQMAGES